MSAITAIQAKADLFKLLEEVTQSHVPVEILGKNANAVLVAEDDWRAIQETLYLLSIPGMRESIKEGLETSVEDCSIEPGW